MRGLGHKADNRRGLERILRDARGPGSAYQVKFEASRLIVLPREKGPKELAEREKVNPLALTFRYF